jgi:hypothetical protein
MAINTRDRRFSIASLLELEILPNPDGTISAADRLQWLGLYRGIPTSAVVYSLVGCVFLYTAANWPTLSWYLEVAMRATSGTAYARLYDVTDSAVVIKSLISTIAGTLTRVRSDALTLTDAHEYRVQFGTLATGSGEAVGATLLGV